ncbi:hypothetical protein [Kitasatospora sp. NPDC089509]|uniref:hypothetical protein n=1 Tax=Kitasatospora sp. NPDC089509 TaxID=3364079 RepID=UPI00381D445D
MTRPTLEQLLDATSPETRARERAATTAPVPEPLVRLLPDRGLPLGAVANVADLGLLIQLGARLAASEWAAVVFPVKLAC